MDKYVRNLSILSVIAAVIGIISAYGSTCPTLDPPTDPTSKLYVMYTLQPVFMITTALTWIAGIAWVIILWAVITRKTWTYVSAIIITIIGAVSGFIPAMLVMANGMPFSPSLMRAFLNLFIFIYLLVPSTALGIKNIPNIPTGAQAGLTTSLVAYLLTAIGIVLMIQPFAVEWTHIIDGVNEYGFAALQFFSGLFSILLAGSIKVSERIHAAHVLTLTHNTEHLKELPPK